MHGCLNEYVYCIGDLNELKKHQDNTVMFCRNFESMHACMPVLCMHAISLGGLGEYRVEFLMTIPCLPALLYLQ